MNGNGTDKPPRPRIEMVSTGTPESEAAAIVAALEQFLADTAPAAAAAAGPELNPWARAALEEGIAARQLHGNAWGHAPRGPHR